MVKARAQATPIPDVGEGKRGPDGYLTYLLRQAHAAVRLAQDRALAVEDMTQAQSSALTMIRAYDGLSSADLARLVMQTPQTVNVIVNALVARGAVEKKADPVHRRILRLHVTEEGCALNKRCSALTRHINESMKAHIPAGAEKHLRQWLSDVARLYAEA